MIKNSHSNFEMNTGHINILKHIPKSCNLDLSNTPKNTKHCPEVEKRKNKIKFKCIIYRYLLWYLPTQIPNLDPQGSVLAGELDLWVWVYAGIDIRNFS